MVGKPEEKGQLGRPTLKWHDCIEMDLTEVGLDDGLDWSSSG